jgi:hypothetical protein
MSPNELRAVARFHGRGPPLHRSFVECRRDCDGAPVLRRNGSTSRSRLRRGHRLRVRRRGPHRALWAPGSNSYLCVKTPTQRTPTANSGGTADACDGSFALDFLDYLATHTGALGAPFSPGDQVWMQAWYRDPAAPATTNSTGGITWAMCP